jgi:hypothetical protein
MDLCVADVHQVFAQTEDNKGDRNVLDTSYHGTVVLRPSIVRDHTVAHDLFEKRLTGPWTDSIL